MNIDSLIGQIFFKKFKVLEFIGKGSFSYVFQGLNIFTNELVAMKFEEKIKQFNLLENEKNILIELEKLDFIPKFIYYDSTDSYNILIIQLLGKNLSFFHNQLNNKFSLFTTIKLGIKIFELIEIFHEKGFIYRDFKPENFVLDEEKKNLFLIDFGSSKKYLNEKNKHKCIKITKNFIGTGRYCSRNAHYGIELSRRDDLESIMFVLIYLSKGKLPWMNIKTINSKLLFQKIAKSKEKNYLKISKGFPNEINIILKYIDELSFRDNPDYEGILKLLKRILINNCNNNKENLIFS